MSRQLAVTTVVRAPAGDGGEPYRTFGTEDKVPDWAADQIGDHCWAEIPKTPAKRGPHKTSS